MKILVTGAKGFVGRNLCAQLNNIKSGKAKWYKVPADDILVYEYDIDSDPAELEVYCKNADFVFNLAGVNRHRIQKSSWKATLALLPRCLTPLRSTEIVVL